MVGKCWLEFRLRDINGQSCAPFMAHVGEDSVFRDFSVLDEQSGLTLWLGPVERPVRDRKGTLN